MDPILLLGAGGHARSCIDVIEQQGLYEIVGLIGKESEIGTDLLGYPIIGTDAELPRLVRDSGNALVTVGQIISPESRIRLYDLLVKTGFNLPRIISPRAYVSRHASVGDGTIVHHGAIVNAGAKIGNNGIINSRALVEHDAIIDHHCHISTGAVINGHARIGQGSFIGSGTVIRETTVIGEHCVIGMGQRITADCAAGKNIPRIREPS